MKVLSKEHIDKLKADVIDLEAALKKMASVPGGMQRMRDFALNMKELKGEKYAVAVMTASITLTNLHNITTLIHPLGRPIMEGLVADMAVFAYVFADIVPDDVFTAIQLLEGDAKDLLKQV